MTAGTDDPLATDGRPMSAGPTRACAVLLNPTAGRGRHRGVVAKALDVLGSAGHEVRVLEVTSRDEALSSCKRAVAEGAAALVVFGGDGTMHLGVQAVGGTEVPFGIVPVGTGNDFATEVGVDLDPVKAAATIAAALREGRTRPVDLAEVSGPDGYHGWFAAVLGAGFDALVNERANAMRWPKGRRRYDLAIFAELLTLHGRHYRITLDGETRELDACLVAVGNGATYGGGMRMCPAADLHDGKLDVVIAGPISRTTLLRLQPKVYQGTHVSHPKVTSYQVTSVRIEAEGITAYADGERTCPLPITVTARPNALRLLL